MSLATETLQVKLKTRLNSEPVFVCQILRRSLHTPAVAVKPFICKELNVSLQSMPGQRFIRKTQLAPNEYRKNFEQIDRDILSVITSAEADKVTMLMSKIYLRLVSAPEKYWERAGVLHIGAELRDEKPLKAWAVLCELVGVASATASKALRWMHEQGIIGYFSGKNGVGVRIFLNRAASSIGVRQDQASKKILAFAPASYGEARASANEPTFNDSYAVREVLDTDINPGAPKNGADNGEADKFVFEPKRQIPAHGRSNAVSDAPLQVAPGAFSLEEVVTRLRSEIAPTMHTAAREAAALEHERTREWLEKRGLPKAARVAQHEAYNVLRKYGVIREERRVRCSPAEVGRSAYVPPEPRILSDDEVNNLAQACIAMLETQGRSIEVTLSGMSTEAGGFLPAKDVGRVREKANSLLCSGDHKRGN